MGRALAGVVAVGVGLFGACGVGGDGPVGPSEASRDEAGPVEDAAAPMARDDARGEEGLDREAVLGPFLSAHWQLPVSAQAAPPEGFSPLEADLSPEACGSCHPKQHAEWRESLHAKAYSPGFAGQLIEGSLAAPTALRSCQTCHAPLEEQQPVTAAGETAPEDRYDPELREAGIVCAGCHVRAHRRYGPPRRPEAPVAQGPLPHAGFEARPEYQEARFCATCHQFWNDAGVNGKPLQNTYAEWRASRHAEEGRTCQSCHMPDRAHHWRGIHDPETVRDAVDVELEGPRLEEGRVRGALAVHNRRVGHAFPTYLTPRIFAALWQEDAEGSALDGTRVELTIGREVDFDAWTEVFDTRILPDETATLPYDVALAPGARALVGRVTVEPDFHYRGVFDSLRESYTDPEARALMEEGHRRTLESPYTLATRRRELPGRRALPEMEGAGDAAAR